MQNDKIFTPMESLNLWLYHAYKTFWKIFQILQGIAYEQYEWKHGLHFINDHHDHGNLNN